MAVSLPSLENQVVVITGASSGIGLVTARMAAKRGAAVVLAARNDGALEELAAEIREVGGQAIDVGADVGDQGDVARIADRALQHFGRFDTWVNNAGVSIFGRIEEVAVEDMRRMFDTVYWGVVYGSLQAVAHYKRRGTAGAIGPGGSPVAGSAAFSATAPRRCSRRTRAPSTPCTASPRRCGWNSSPRTRPCP